MPEYLAPGVYVEEVSFRSKSIEGVGTTTTGFVGPTRYGPLYDPPDVLTSLADFENTYGDGQQLDFDGELIDNYMWQAARAFFTEGGTRLYVKRIYQGSGMTEPGNDQGGQATGTIGDLTITARYPGAYGNFHVRLHARRRPERARVAERCSRRTRRLGRRRRARHAGEHDDVPLRRVVPRRGHRPAHVAVRLRRVAGDDRRALEPRPGRRHGADRDRERVGRAERAGCGGDGLGGTPARPAARDRRRARLGLRRVRRDEQRSTRHADHRRSRKRGDRARRPADALRRLAGLLTAGHRRRGGAARPELDRGQPLARRRPVRRHRRREPVRDLLRGRRPRVGRREDRAAVASRTSTTSRSSRRRVRRQLQRRTPTRRTRS